MKGLVSFMIDKELTTGAIMPAPPDEQKRKFAEASLEWTKAQPEVQAAFPDLDDIVKTARELRPLSDEPTAVAVAETTSVAAGCIEPKPTLDVSVVQTEECAEKKEGISSVDRDTSNTSAPLDPRTTVESLPPAEDVDDDPRPLVPGDVVRIRVCDPSLMTPEDRQYMGREGVIKKGTKPGLVRVMLARPGDVGVNLYFRIEQVERLKRSANEAGKLR